MIYLLLYLYRFSVFQLLFSNPFSSHFVIGVWCYRLYRLVYCSHFTAPIGVPLSSTTLGPGGLIIILFYFLILGCICCFGLVFLSLPFRLLVVLISHVLELCSTIHAPVKMNSGLAL